MSIAPSSRHSKNGDMKWKRKSLILIENHNFIYFKMGGGVGGI